MCHFTSGKICRRRPQTHFFVVPNAPESPSSVSAFDSLRRHRPAQSQIEHLDLLLKIGERHDATPAQVALAWLLAQKSWIVPLFGTRKLERSEENIGALAVCLTREDVRELNASRTTMPVQGNRYRDEHMRRVGL
jgi:aryl-alcohol dehydrogenase-like predicted oxidoreductase